MAEDNTPISEVSKENFIKDNKIYILGPFDRSISQNIVPGIAELIGNKISEKDSSLVFYINSFGGYTAELLSVLAMIELAKKLGITIITHTLGVAYSCASLLAVHGDHRLMYKNAKNLMHLGSTAFESKTFKQLERGHENAKKWFNTIVQMYVEHTKMSEDEVKKALMDDNYYLDAKQCKKFGLCDEII